MNGVDTKQNHSHPINPRYEVVRKSPEEMDRLVNDTAGAAEPVCRTRPIIPNG